jgi:hypothetical protein
MEMTAGVRLQYLEKESQQVRLTESGQFPAESFAAQNTIFLGMPRTAGYLNQMLEKTNSYIDQVSPDLIRNSKLSPGEPAEFQEVSYSADRRPAPAILTLLPARPERTRMLLLLGAKSHHSDLCGYLARGVEASRRAVEERRFAGCPGNGCRARDLAQHGLEDYAGRMLADSSDVLEVRGNTP